MARKFSGATDVASITANLSGQTGATVAAWLWRDASPAGKVVFEYANGAAGFDVVTNGVTDIMRSYGGGVASWADSYPIPSLNAWHHYLWIFRAQTFNRVIIDGVDTGVTNAGHVAEPGYTWSNNTLTFAGRIPLVGTPLQGRFAEFALWNGIASNSVGHGAPEQTGEGLFAGWTPFRVFGSPTIYVPMLGNSPEPDYSGNRTPMNLTGTTVANHPATKTLFMAGAT